MRIVVVGGTGLVGSKVVTRLRGDGHEVVPAARSLGIDTITGEGLAEALDGASVVVDVSNSPTLAYPTARDFFETSTANLLAAETAADVGHHVVLSIVGTRHVSESADLLSTNAGYFRAKLIQEELIRASSIPFTIVQATQFFEFMKTIIDGATDEGTVRLPPALFQPIAAADAAGAVARAAVAAPWNGIVEVGGPETIRFEDAVRRFLRAERDPREVITDPDVAYFGIAVHERTLVPGTTASRGAIRLDDWLRESLITA